MATPRKSYVYMLFRPDGSPCYVGKGINGRWVNHERAGSNHANPNLARIFALAGGPIPRVKLRTGLTNEEACQIEVALIAAIGRKKRGGPLVNMTDGGDGQCGWLPSDETRKRIGTANTGLKRSEEVRRKMSEAHKGRKKSEEHKRAIGSSQVGKKISEEAKARHRASIIRHYQDPYARQKVSDWHKAMSPEAKAERSRKLSIAAKAQMKRQYG